MLCGVFCAALTAVPVLADTEVQKYTNTDFAMDTVVSETLYTTGDDLNTALGQKIRDIETEYLSWTDEDSQIAKLNAASGETTEVSDELAGYLEKIFQLAKDSNGAFDPTIGKIIRLWDITGENPHVPEQSELDELLKDVGYQKVSLDGDKDVVSDFLKTQEDVSGMILNLGGSSVMAYGEKPDGSDWKVAVTDPRDVEGDYLGAITLEGGEFLSTSGDYEKYFMEDGKRYHHILDPKTGYPVGNGLDSVTVVCDSGLLADGLSTACFVLGMDDALELLEKYNAEAVFVDEDKNVYLTSGMKDRFELMKNTYTVKEAE